MGAKLRIVRADGLPVAADSAQTGEIQPKRWHVIGEYFRDAANTAALFTSQPGQSPDLAAHLPR